MKKQDPRNYRQIKWNIKVRPPPFWSDDLGVSGVRVSARLRVRKKRPTRREPKPSRSRFVLSNLTWGKSCSPLLVQDLVVVTGGEEHEKSLLAYDASTGKPVWRAGRDAASYCSPLVASLSGQEQIVIVNAHSVTGHALDNGEILWEYGWPDNFAKATEPLVVDTNRVFIAAGYGVGCAMLRIERSAAEGWSATPLWNNRNLKPKFTNLVRRGQYVYGLDEGVLTCVNLEQGKREWKEGHYGHGQILLVDDLLVVQAESGEIVLVD